jgi:hypothetical protein
VFTTYGYHTPPRNPERVTIDGREYKRIERLPRNLRPGDLLAIGDNTDRAEYHRVYVTIVDVDSEPQEIRGWRRYPPQCVIRFKFPAHMYPLTWRWRTACPSG